MSTKDHGFQADLPRLFGRRQALTMIGATAAMALPGMSYAAQCVADATETEGPYPADGSGRILRSNPNVLTESGVIRDDLRQSFGPLSGTTDGVPLTLELELVNVDNACAPLAGYAIYIWHCDALGKYSLYDIEDQNYLRGVALTNAAGKARFTTIYPGCYPSRWPHIHFEVFSSPDAMTSGRDSLLISQLAFTEADSAMVYDAHAAYSNGLANLARNSLSRDMVFGDDTDAQTRQRTLAISGNVSDSLSGTARIGLRA